MSAIAVDIMGGDNAPIAIMEGIAQAIKEQIPFDRLFLVGKEDVIKAELKRLNLTNNPKLEIVHAEQVVEMHDKAASSIRSKRKSSINVAVNLVKKGQAQAVVSAGSTGAAVASTVIKLRTLPGVERPAIATTIPTPTGEFLLLDVGANIECKPKHLVHYAIMGNSYAEHILGRKNPRIGILSVGSEDIKGNELTKETFKLLNNLSENINFIGNVEGDDLFSGSVDVVVCDGFVGNAVLKCCESLAKSISTILKESLKKNIIRQCGAILAKNAFKELKQKCNPEEYGGAILLGINGVCIIGHGSSSPCAVKNAIRVAGEFISHQVNKHIIAQIKNIQTIPATEEILNTNKGQ